MSWPVPHAALMPPSAVPGVIEVARGSVNNDPWVDFTDLPIDMFMFELLLRKVEPTVGGTNLLLRVSTDNGATFDAGVNDYQFTGAGSQIGSGVFQAQSSGDATGINCNSAQTYGSGSEFAGSGRIRVHGLQDATMRTTIEGHMTYQGNSAYGEASFGGQRFGLTAHNAFRLLFSSGNIKTMEFLLLGVR